MIGAGLIGRRHIEQVVASQRATLVAVADPDLDAMAAVRDAGVARYPNLEDVLDGAHPDGVILATPNTLHLSQALACIWAGIPLLVEKPIATSVAEGRRIAEAADRAGVPVLVGHHRRHSPRLVAAQRIVDGGLLGDVVAVTAATMFAKPPEYFAGAEWRRLAGGGPILINLIHDVDALRVLAGDVIGVQAMASNGVRREPVEETVAVTMRFASGAIGSLILSDAAASPLSWEMTAGEDRAFPRYGNRDCYVVAGTHGALGIPTLRLTAADGMPSWRRRMRSVVTSVTPGDPLSRQLEHFVDVVEGRATPLVTAWDAVDSLAVTVAIAEAARTGTMVVPDRAHTAPRPRP